MPEYLAPGVYVEEIDGGPRPIEGVSTSTAGMVGVTEMGPSTGLPRLITGLPQFQQIYGGYLSEDWGDARYLPLAVQGFFENGGKRVYIMRVIGAGALRSFADLPAGGQVGGANVLFTQVSSGVDSGSVTLDLVSSRGIEVGTTITVIEASHGAIVTDPGVQVDGVAGDTLTLHAGLANAYSTNAVVYFAAPAGVNVGTALTVRAADEGDWGDGLRVRTTPSTRSSGTLALAGPAAKVVQQTLNFQVEAQNAAGTTVTLGPVHAAVTRLRNSDILTVTLGGATETPTVQNRNPATGAVTVAPALGQDYTTGTASVTIGARASTAGQDPVKLDSVAGFEDHDIVRMTLAAQERTGTISVVDAPNKVITVDFDAPPAQPWNIPVGTRVELLSMRHGASVRIAGGRTFYAGAALEFQAPDGHRVYRRVTGAPDGDLVPLNSPLPAGYVEGTTVRSCEFDLAVDLVRVDPATQRESIVRSESLKHLSLATNAFNYAPARVAAGLRLIRLDDPPAGGNSPPFNQPTTIDIVNPDRFVAYRQLSGGHPGAIPTDGAYRGTDHGPGQRTGIQALQDRDDIAIIAAPGTHSEAVHAALIDQCERLRYRFAVLDPEPGVDADAVITARREFDTHYAALYFPWIRLRDPLTDSDIDAPPSGHVVGIYARTDVERGVYKAPANEVVRGASDVQQLVDKGLQDVLNPPPNQINVIRDFRTAGRGLRVWGARVITSDSNWKYVNVRRLFIFLEHSLDIGTQWVTFEPNDERLWARVRQTATDFLTRVWRDGALMGTKPEEAFFVKCDRTTMTSDDLANGRLILIIGVAPVFPAEFVIIRIGQWTGGGAPQQL
jgi:phage tail sheath protein FI